MAVDVAPLAPPNAGPLHRLIRRARVLLRTTQVATGLALTAGLLLGAAALVVAVDLLLPLLQLPYWLAHGCDSGLRLASLCLVVAPPAVAFLVGVLFPLFRRLTTGRVARRIEAHIPDIHNRLVSCIDLEAARPGNGVAGLLPPPGRRVPGTHPRLPRQPRPRLPQTPSRGPGRLRRRRGVRCRVVPLRRPDAHGLRPHLPPLRRHSASRRRGLHRRAARRRLPARGEDRLLRRDHARPGRFAHLGVAGRQWDDKGDSA